MRSAFCVTCSDRSHLRLEDDGKWRCVDLGACINRRLGIERSIAAAAPYKSTPQPDVKPSSEGQS